MLVDGPPGIGCPVIASVTAAHDLQRVAKTVKGFSLPLAVCINKRDVGSR